MSTAPVILELKGITKRFPGGVLANDKVDFDLRRGEVHALLGENGAGKSTLMNVLYGLYQPDEGEIHVHGKRVSIRSPKDAIDLGIGMVHQHFMLIPVMTVAENIVLATEPKKAGVLLDYDAAVRSAENIARTFNFSINPRARVQNIGVGQQQRVEILKALYRGAEILILDEPTAVLTPQEAKELFEILESLKSQGKSIIFPRRRTVIRSAICSTSLSLCVMKITDMPSFVSDSRMPKSSSVSCGVKTAVGSSRIRTSAPR